MKRLPRRRRSPRMRTLLAFGLLGAAVNVAVAWGLMLRSPGATLDANGMPQCLAWDEAPGGTISVDARCGYLWISQAKTRLRPVTQQPISFGCEFGEWPDTREPIDGPAFQSMVPAGSVFCGTTPLPALMHLVQPGDDSITVTEQSSGLPMLAMRYTLVERDDWDRLRSPSVDARSTGMLIVRNSSNTRVGLPFLPLWPGFAINTAFYAAICWLLFAAPFALRRRLRLRLGRCAACAYPVGSSPFCTECGKPVQSCPARGDGM
jgi:hypothetical protein